MKKKLNRNNKNSFLNKFQFKMLPYESHKKKMKYNFAIRKFVQLYYSL